MRHLFDQHIQTYRRAGGLNAIPCWLVLVGKASTDRGETGLPPARPPGRRELSANFPGDRTDFLKFTQLAAARAL